MLLVLLPATAALYWSDRMLRRDRPMSAATGLTATILLGLLFLVLQGMELKKHTAAADESAYGSIMVAITGAHAVHVFIGLLMVGYLALLLPRLLASGMPVRRPLVNVALYWDFLAALWVLTLALLYFLPYLRWSGA